MKPTPDLTRSRTAWTALATVVVTIFGPKLGLTEIEVAAIVTATQAVVVSLYVQDKRTSKR